MAPLEDPRSPDFAKTLTAGEAIIAALQTENSRLCSENAALIGRLSELERRLGPNSSISGNRPQRRAEEASTAAVRPAAFPEGVMGLVRRMRG